MERTRMNRPTHTMTLSDADWSVIDAALCLYASLEAERAQSDEFPINRRDAREQEKIARRLMEHIGTRNVRLSRP
jgi:hypothetical protein